MIVLVIVWVPALLINYIWYKKSNPYQKNNWPYALVAFLFICLIPHAGLYWNIHGGSWAADKKTLVTLYDYNSLIFLSIPIIFSMREIVVFLSTKFGSK